MLEKGIRGEICEASHSYVKANNKYMNNYDEKINSSYIANLDANNLKKKYYQNLMRLHKKLW